MENRLGDLLRETEQPPFVGVAAIRGPAPPRISPPSERPGFKGSERPPAMSSDIISRLTTRLRVPQLVNRVFARRHLSILMYHGVIRAPLDVPIGLFLPVDSFREQMDYLKRRFQVFPLRSAVARCLSGEIDGPTAAITFDDGFQNNFEIAYPILRELGLPATIFLTTGFVDSPQTLWFTRLHRAIAHTTRKELAWRGRSLPLTTTSERAVAWRMLKDELRRLPHPELVRRLHAVEEELDADLSTDGDLSSPYRVLDRTSIQAMAASGLIDFGGHTRDHTILSLLSPEEKRHQIRSSIETVEEITGRPCRVFAYPNGQPADYDRDCVAVLRASKVEMAVTTIHGGNTPDSPPMELRRYGIGADTDLSRFQLIVHHALGLAKRALRRT